MFYGTYKLMMDRFGSDSHRARRSFDTTACSEAVTDSRDDQRADTARDVDAAVAGTASEPVATDRYDDKAA